MYAWIWRKLPGNVWVKLTQSLALLTATGLLLWYVIFPWATPLLPFDDVQVGTGTEQQQPDADTVDPSSDAGPDEIPYNTDSNDTGPRSVPAIPGN